jgi:murein tripeptide amidase MpaA
MGRKKRKEYLVVVVCLMISSAGFGHQTAPLLSGQAVISMDLKAYRSYLVLGGPPLDRLYKLNDRLYFLVDSGDLGRMAAGDIAFSQASLINAGNRIGPGGGNGRYHSHMEALTRLQILADAYPHLARSFSIGASIEGRALQVIKISDNVSQEEPEANIFIVGCHHGREWISVEVPLLFAEYLLENRDVDPRVRHIVDNCQIFILPIQNPDGLEFSIHYHSMWRKNRRYVGDLIWGVDPNRNYGFAWGYDDTGSSPDPLNGTYRGAAPFSEPETTAVRDFLLSHPPAGSLSFHNFSQLILYPWGYTAEPCPDDEEFARIAAGMSDLIYQVSGRIYTYGAGATTIYPTNGDTDDWIYGTFGAPAFTIELPPESFSYGGFITSENMIDSVVDEMRPAILHFIEQVMTRLTGEKQPE